MGCLHCRALGLKDRGGGVVKMGWCYLSLLAPGSAKLVRGWVPFVGGCVGVSGIAVCDTISTLRW